MKRITAMLLFLLATVSTFAGDAEIKKAWIDDFGYENDVYGRYAHVGFVINDCRGQACKVKVYLKDANGKYVKNSNGNVVVFSSTFYPASSSAKFHDYRVFCPLKYMNIKSSSPSKNYYLVIYIADANGNYIGNSSSMKFTY